MRTLGTSVFLFFACVSVAAANPPNIVLVIGDDIEWSHYGFMAHPIIQTPNLDRLAAEGVVFTQGQVPASICRPTLQTLLSGLHPVQWELKRDALPPTPPRHEVAQYRTLPRELQRRGYLSWEGGKFWEGSYAQAGFTHGLATEPTAPWGEIGGVDFGRSEEAPLEPLLEFLDTVGGRPFFLWFAPMLPHKPLDPPEEFLSLYAGYPSIERQYYAQVTRLDALIGALLEELEARGLRQNTLIVYLGDNGWALSPGPDGKASLYDSGTRTPIIFSWPGRIAAGIREEVVAAEDLFPTLLSFAELRSPPDRDGMSLREVLDRGAAVPRQKYVSWQSGDARAGFFVRTQEWRYIRDHFNGPTEGLYHIPTDPYEQENLAAVRPDLIEGFRKDVVDWVLQVRGAPERLEALGRLVDEEGQPVSRRLLRLVGDDGTHSARTDRRGWLLFGGLSAGDYRLCGLDFSLPIGPTGAYLGALPFPCLSR